MRIPRTSKTSTHRERLIVPIERLEKSGLCFPPDIGIANLEYVFLRQPGKKQRIEIVN